MSSSSVTTSRQTETLAFLQKHLLYFFHPRTKNCLNLLNESKTVEQVRSPFIYRLVSASLESCKKSHVVFSARNTFSYQPPDSLLLSNHEAATIIQRYPLLTNIRSTTSFMRMKDMQELTSSYEISVACKTFSTLSAQRARRGEERLTNEGVKQHKEQSIDRKGIQDMFCFSCHEWSEKRGSNWPFNSGSTSTWAAGKKTKEREPCVTGLSIGKERRVSLVKHCVARVCVETNLRQIHSPLTSLFLGWGFSCFRRDILA